MIRLNLHEAKTHLSRHLRELSEGEVILLCRRNVPIAEIRALPARSDEPRPIGLARGELSVPDSFFEALPDELVGAFDGRG